MQSLMSFINVNYCMYVIACLVKLLISSLAPLVGRHLGLTIMSVCIEFNSNHNAYYHVNLNLKIC